MDTLPAPIANALQFEKANWSNGGAAVDAFYTLPNNTTTAEAPPGSLLKLEPDADSTKYLLPAATTISRIIYQSATLAGTPVSVSACILWPYSPRSLPDGHAIVAWAHGTSGLTPTSAPSSHKRIGQHFFAPYQLLLQGYVVVATDYAGLGVGKYPSGEPIVHQYLAHPAHANDVVYAVQAARTAFPQLSENFVTVGHSQGGGAAWAVAQRQAQMPIKGYLGAVAVSPSTRVLDEPGAFQSILVAGMCTAIASTIPEFDPGTVLTAECAARVKINKDTAGGIASGTLLMMAGGIPILQPNWRQNPQLQEYHSQTSNGGKPVSGPLLVVHGSADPRLNISVTTSAVEATAKASPDARIRYLTLPDVAHDAALPASQRVWMDWIEERFAAAAGRGGGSGDGGDGGLRCEELVPARPGGVYQKEQNWYLEPVGEFWQLG